MINSIGLSQSRFRSSIWPESSEVPKDVYTHNEESVASETSIGHGATMHTRGP